MSLTLAAALTIGMHVASIHAPQRAQHNDNAGLYLRTDSGLSAGVYRNSHRRTSLYVGQAFPLVGQLDLNVGLVSGYQKRCRTWSETSSTTSKQMVAGSPEYSTVTYSVPREECTGFSRGAITPMFAFSYAAPFSVLGATPRLWFMPGFGKVSSVAHLSLETNF